MLLISRRRSCSIHGTPSIDEQLFYVWLLLVSDLMVTVQIMEQTAQGPAELPTGRAPVARISAITAWMGHT